MNAKKAVKVILDFVLALGFTLFFNQAVLGGLAFHEIAGLVIGGLFIFHKLLNWQWIKQVSKSFFTPRLSIKTCLGYILDFFLLIAAGFILISGILISKVVFGFQSFTKDLSLYHRTVSYIALILIGIHIGLHWSWVTGFFKRLFNIKKTGPAIRIISATLSVLLFAFGIYNIVSTNFFSGIVAFEREGGGRELEQRAYHSSLSGSSYLNIINVAAPNAITGSSPIAPNRGNALPQASSGDTVPGAAGNNDSMPQATASPSQGQNANENNPSGQQPIPGQRPGSGIGRQNGGELERTALSNVLDVLCTYLSIMSVFAIATYYLDKLLCRKRKKPVAA